MNGMIVQLLINNEGDILSSFLYIGLVKIYYDIYVMVEEIR